MIRIDIRYPGLSTLAKRHYLFLNPKRKDGQFKAISLIKRIIAARSAAVLAHDAGMVAFWNYFLANDCENLKRVIIGRPNVLEQVIQEISVQFPALDFTRIVKGQFASSAIGNKVLDVFNYSAMYRSKKECHETYAKLNISSCPYCNEGVVKVDLYQAGVNKLNLIGHQLDHFFSQVLHPFLSLSFFNLIPVCSTCNTIYKMDTDFNINDYINPFDKSVNDEFEFFLENILPDTAQDIIVKYRQKITFPRTALDVFNIENRYNHIAVKKQLFNAYQTLRYHSNSVIESIENQFGIQMSLENDFNLTIKLQIFQASQEESEILINQYGKLKRDIFYSLRFNEN